ncbi:MAG: VWA domain-containing protein, partial [bacterium]|nr:VWA domain-containing protein [bacterium]
VQCPLTADYDAFRMFLEQVDVETISSGTTALDQALRTAVRTFESMPDKKNKLLVLVTDGEDFSSNLSDTKQRASQEGLHVFTLGVGSPEGAPVPLIDHEGNSVGHQLDGQGKVVISRLNEGVLSTLSHDVGGTYIHLDTHDDKDLHMLVQKVQSFEKEKLADRSVAQREQLYPFFLLISFICFASEWLL